MFKFVEIPADNDRPIIEHEASAKGGLEADELQIYAKKHYSKNQTVVSEEQRLEQLKKQLSSQGIDLTNVEPSMLKAALAIEANNASIEIIQLMVATKEYDYIGCTLYCDATGSMKGAQPNARATHILQLCGITNTTVLGDAFIGKCYDNEEFPWVRRSLTVADVVGSDSPGAYAPQDAWLVQSALRANKGKNLSAYSTAGQLQKMSDMHQNKQKEDSKPQVIAVKGTCNECGNNQGEKLTCSGCKNAYYCNKDCQKKHWKQHKKYCTFKK